MSDNPPPHGDTTDAASNKIACVNSLILIMCVGPVLATENRRLKEQIGKLETEVKSV